ncbi:hypothetical protein [Sporomusa termitida]|uniref:Uncharacterized protein n=1 Tax=Sporomusa termitida TaxID=2377 RepID=A0A517DVN9_9FIRM|nr:hypothetical protein [Sporomusa termitida]QDR81336.1 hypothetical protein SPTER_27150 [Sporomusa termitida]
MEVNEVKVTGSLKLTLRKADGAVEVRRKDNIIVSTGFDAICDSLGKTSGRPAAFGYIALGTGTAAPALSQSALVSEIARQAATYAHVAGTQVMTFSSTFEPGAATGAISEAGVFNGASAGTMLDRVLFNVINKGENDTLTAQFQFTLS